MNENDSNVAVLEKPAKQPNKIITPCHKEEILNELAKETSQYQLAETYKISQSRISQIKKENEALVANKKAELIKLLPSVVDVVTDDLAANKLLSKRIRMNPYNVDSEKVALKNTLDKTSVNLLKIAGIFPSQAMINFNQHNDNRTQTTVISDNVLGLFHSHARELIDAEVVDANGDTTNDG